MAKRAPAKTSSADAAPPPGADATVGAGGPAPAPAEVAAPVSADRAGEPERAREAVPHLVLSRRYRPGRFAELVGQEHVAQTLSNAIESGRIGHAYLFVGPRGTGKTTTARILAKALNCARGPTPEPCGACDSCVGIARGNDLDVVEMDAASNNSVDDVRALRDSVGYRPARSRFRIWIVDEVHMLSTAASNAFLKTLEEPPPQAKFLFCTTEPHRLPDTFLSRVQRLELRRIPDARIAERLLALAAKEGASLEPGVETRIAEGATGGLRDAESLLEQLLACARGGRVTLADLDAVSGRAAGHDVEALLDAALAGDAGAALDAAGACLAAGAKPDVVLDQAIEALRELLGLAARRKAAAPAPDPATSPRDARAVAFGVPRLARSLDLLLEKRRHLRDGAEGRLVVEIAAVELARLPSARDLDAVLAALARGAGSDGAPSGGEPRREGASAAPDRPRPAASAPVPTPRAFPSREEPSRASSVRAPASPGAGDGAGDGERAAAGAATAAAPDFDAVVARWPEIVAAVGRRSRRVGSALARTRVVGVETDVVFLSVSTLDAVAKAALRGRETADLLRDATREAFGVGLRPVVTDGPDAGEPRAPGGAPAPASGAAPSPASAHEAVPPGGGEPGRPRAAPPTGSAPPPRDGGAARPDDVRAHPDVKALLDAFGARVLAVQRVDRDDARDGAEAPGTAST